MSAPRNIPDRLRDDQIAVSDPDKSAWVAANAGSGKTHVLAQRVINLLLKRCDPAKILCLTFTKAAAANMAKRVFDGLAEWITLDDAALDAAIRNTSNLPPGPELRALARRLFARALETPGGLKVQTIHAFCTQLLHRFPFEADVAARFSVLDAAAEKQLLENLTLDVLLEAAAAPEGALGRALATTITFAADQTFREVVSEAIGKRDVIEQWLKRCGSVEAAIADLTQALGVQPGDTLESVEAEFLNRSPFAPDEWPAVAAALAEGSKNDCEQSARFAGLAAAADGERLELYIAIFCTGERSPRANIVTKTIRNNHPDLFARLTAEQPRVCALLARRLAVASRDRSAALLAVTAAVLARYRVEKERRGLLDYDDLVDKTLALLDSVDAAWVHFKLDLGIDHVLIDEAQDTSRKQWDIIRKLVAEFTAGAGARPGKRTIFAVGDEKQSIFSFQDAAPQEFAEMRAHFRRAHSANPDSFLVTEFKHSFRSGEAVLGAVDAVFARREIYASVTSDTDGFPPHIALPDAAPGLVEIWEPEKPDDKREIEGWDAPFDAVSETSPRVKLARCIARTVRALIASGEPVGLEHERRPVRYGDVLVLVRQRGPLFEAIIRALKNEHVEVAGADRLVLDEHIAVMDLIALADALLLPQDDLALATVLRSPLFGWSDEDLFAIAWNRGRGSLRAALAGRTSEKPLFAATAAELDVLAAAARRESPFSFYARLLGAGGARERFVGRLGPEANDALDEFLNLALDYQRRETSSLQGFVAFLRAAHAEVKRDMEIARNEVRVMTVHGAKGLEAPIVILADTMTPPCGPRPPRLLTLPGAAAPMLWVGRKDDDVPVAATARTRALAEAENEYRRLLYVAMTRAADRLIVCGADGMRARPKGCWYDLVCDALKPLSTVERDGDADIRRFRKGAPDAKGMDAPPQPVAPVHVQPVLPQWLRKNAPADAPRLSPLSPSDAYDEETEQRPNAAATAGNRRKAMKRGLLAHRLLQSLPDIVPAGRAAVAWQYLARNGNGFTAEEHAQIAAQVLTVLDDARFAALFAPGSRAEVPIVGRIARAGRPPVAVAGQVDRLAITADGVLIADYKTNRPAPRHPAEVPPPYLAQLALYRAVLGRLYPGKPVRAALVWTDIPDLMEISPQALAAALAEVLTTDAAEVTAG